MARQRPLIAIVGRPNVGKSTLFNRLVGSRKAVVHPRPGMTRDRHYSDAEYRMRQYTLIDTGGYEDSTASTMLQQMRQQSIIAMEEADRVIFLTDINQPDNPIDHEIMNKLRASGKPFFLAVNKCEGRMSIAQAYADFSIFGLDEIFPVSGLHGDGVYDLMDKVTEGFEQWDPDEEVKDTNITRVAIVGRQNVGKSTLLNTLFGQERVIANPEGGTTRDAIDQEITVSGRKYTVIDTAGIRRRGKIKVGPEMLSVHSSYRAIDRADVCLLVIDTVEGITAQDLHVAGYVLDRKRACIILLNKWDLVEDREKRFGEIIRDVRDKFSFMRWAPIITISAMTGQRTHRVWGLIDNCYKQYSRRFRTRELNIILKRAMTHVSPPTRRGSQLKVNYVTQTDMRPPTISLFVNDPRLVYYSYHRYLKNQFYMQLNLEGTPLRLRFRRKAPPRGWEKVVRTMESGYIPSEHKGESIQVYDYMAGAFMEEGDDYKRHESAGSHAGMSEEDEARYYNVEEDDDEDYTDYGIYDEDDDMEDDGD